MVIDKAASDALVIKTDTCMLLRASAVAHGSTYFSVLVHKASPVTVNIRAGDEEGVTVVGGATVIDESGHKFSFGRTC